MATPELVQEYKSSLLQRSSQDGKLRYVQLNMYLFYGFRREKAIESEDNSVLEDFFSSKGQEEKQGREPGDNVIYKELDNSNEAKVYMPHYSRHNKDILRHGNQLKLRFDTSSLSEKFKAKIVPSHIRSKVASRDAENKTFSSQRQDSFRSQPPRRSRYGLENMNVPTPKKPEVEDDSNIVKVLKKELSDAQITLKARDKYIKQLEEKLSSGDNTQSEERSELRKKLEIAESRVDDLQEDLLESKAKNVNLKKQLMKATAERQQVLGKLKAAETKASDLAAEKSKRKELIKKLSLKIESIEKKVAQKKKEQSENGQLGVLRKQLADAELKNKALSASLENLVLKVSASQD